MMTWNWLAAVVFLHCYLRAELEKYFFRTGIFRTEIISELELELKYELFSEWEQSDY